MYLTFAARINLIPHFLLKIHVCRFTKFTVEKIDVKDSYKDLVDKNFHSYTVINGTGVISDGNSVIDLNKEETVYIKEGVNYSIKGNLELIKSYV